jgi:DNA-binding response OmpR family regulator
MVVDDDPQLTRLVKMGLEMAGFKVEEAWDGDKALKMMRKHPPDLLILDLMMPRKDGWEVLRQVREDPGLAELPVILLTARSGDPDTLRGWEMGADDYVTKPFSPSSLTGHVRDLLGSTGDERKARRRSELARLSGPAGRVTREEH